MGDGDGDEARMSMRMRIKICVRDKCTGENHMRQLCLGKLKHLINIQKL